MLTKKVYKKRVQVGVTGILDKIEARTDYLLFGFILVYRSSVEVK